MSSGAATIPDLTGELALMTDDISSGQAKPVQTRFELLLDALVNAKAHYAICGAVAMGAHGTERYTKDIDVLVADADLERVANELAPAMTVQGREPATGASKQIRLRAAGAGDDRSVDVDLMAPDAVEAWALATSVRGRAFGRKVDLVSVEALVLMKLRAYLSDPEGAQGPLHRADAIALLAANPAIDLAALRAFVRSDVPLAAELERALATPPPRGRLG